MWSVALNATFEKLISSGIIAVNGRESVVTLQPVISWVVAKVAQLQAIVCLEDAIFANPLIFPLVNAY